MVHQGLTGRVIGGLHKEMNMNLLDDPWWKKYAEEVGLYSYRNPDGAHVVFAWAATPERHPYNFMAYMSDGTYTCYVHGKVYRELSSARQLQVDGWLDNPGYTFYSIDGVNSVFLDMEDDDRFSQIMDG